LSLENKIANWVDLGIMHYSEAMNIQDRLIELRGRNLIADTILAVRHPLTVSFGADEKNNQFSDLFLAKVAGEYGDISHSSLQDYLLRRGIPFVKSFRGGGATVFAPGQFVFYPIVNHTEITGSHELDVGAYKNKIYFALFDSLKNMGVDGINMGSQESFQTRAERRDVWLNRGGITYKMGSKGIGIKGKVAYNGFAINVDKDGISDSWIVNQCGYRPEEVKLWTVEHEIGRPVAPSNVYAAVQKAVSNNFGYSGFNYSSTGQLEVAHAS